MRVLEATDFYFPWIAGPAPFIRNLSSGLLERGHDVVVVCPSPHGWAFDESAPPPRHRVRTWPVPFGYHLRSGFPFLDLRRFVGQWRPDVVHIHHPFPISSAALIVAKQYDIPVVATNHTIPSCTLFGLKETQLYRPVEWLFSTYINAFLKQCVTVTTPTRTAAGMLREIGFSGPIEAVSNGVDTHCFQPSDVNDYSRAEIPIVLYTGRLDDDKNTDTIIDAIPHVLKRTKARFRIGGEGTDRARLQQKVTALNLSHVVSFTGYVSDSELPQVYKNADVYVIASTVELQSLSTLDAMASGLPVVAVDAGALPELVKSGMNGYVVSPGDSEAFGNAVAEVLLNRDRRRAMGEHSRLIAESHSLAKMVSQYEEILHQATLKAQSGVIHGSASTG